MYNIKQTTTTTTTTPTTPTTPTISLLCSVNISGGQRPLQNSLRPLLVRLSVVVVYS